ncbi:MAG: glutamate 5-kinase [Candidatus Diapherotrites archaeon]|nr:glutamate 5-kinase [Candidatus Diapherotrites archaeon]
MIRNELFKSIQRVVVKIGTSSISNDQGINLVFLTSLANQVKELQSKGVQVIIVSSGAIGSGAKVLGLKAPIRVIELQQVSAAVGQPRLMQAYENVFSGLDLKVAQILLTYDVFENRRKYLNLRNALNELLKLNVVPIINENDVVAVDEIGPTFTDNDKLSALVAAKLNAQLLVNLTSTEGVYSQNPNLSKNKNFEVIKVVDKITPELEKIAGKPSMHGTGGMYSKVQAAKICMKAGIFLVIASSKQPNVLNRIVSGEELGTLFLPKEILSNKQRWIAFGQPKGILLVDNGAMLAVQKDKSLLAIGVREIIGSFEKNEIVSLVCSGKEFARGLTNFSSSELKKIKGLNSDQAAMQLGKKVKSVVLAENLIKMN